MRELDGSEGGGQLLRTALTLSAATGTPFRMSDVRGGRSEPGLRNQHLGAVAAVAALCDADVDGASAGSEEVRFEPGSAPGGEATVDLRTAGSTTLVLDAVLPLSVRADEPLSVTARGGTDVKWSPTAAYYRRVKCRLLAAAGVEATVRFPVTGFYPAGGGRAELAADPASPSPLALTERGAPGTVTVHSKAAASLSERDVAERQADAATEFLADRGLDVDDRTVSYAEADCPGSAILVRASYEQTVMGGNAVGERGKPAEEVGEAAARSLWEAREGPGAVDAYMADQLMVFLALVGGRVRIPAVTDHVRTNASVIESFDVPVSLDETGAGVLVEVG